MIKNFGDKVAVITGAGSGIGRSLALAFANEGMNLVIVDVNEETLGSVSKEIENLGVDVMSKIVDVSNREQMAQLADDTYERFGRANVLCNNAGIGTSGPLHEIPLENWDWIIGVNLYGVVYGIHFFLNRMIKSDEECHIVNTSSMSGLLPSAQECLYSVTKHGVLALSDGLNQYLRLMSSKVGVSVLCPGYINTNIIDNSQALAENKNGLYQMPEDMQEVFEPVIDNFRQRLHHGMHPDVVAQMVIDSIRKDRLFIITHPNFLQAVDMKINAIHHDAEELDTAMRNLGIVVDNKEMKTYTHAKPPFSISYPANWAEQKPTLMMAFDFMAVSDTVVPGMVVRVSDIPEGGLDVSMDMAAKILSESMSMVTSVVSKTKTRLKDNTSALEGEIEARLPNSSRLMHLVLQTIKDDTLVSVLLTSTKLRYNDTMKQRLIDIAYTMTFH